MTPMSLNIVETIRIPDSRGSIFDHGAFDPSTRRVFVAHTSCNRLEVVDHDARRHIATLPDFPEAAGVVADAGEVLVTNRGAASLSLVDASTLQTRAVFDTGASTQRRRHRRVKDLRSGKPRSHPADRLIGDDQPSRLCGPEGTFEAAWRLI